MQFDWWTFGFQVINLSVLMWLLSHFMFRPIARIIADRRAETQKVLDAAEAAKQQAAKAEAAAKTEAEKNAAERLKIIETARKEAHAQKQDILDQARKDAAEIAQTAQADAKRKAAEARKTQRDAATELAVLITRRLLAHLPDDARVAGYPARLKDALQDLTPEQRQALSADLHLVAPRKLSETERDAAIAAIHAAIPDAPAPAVDLDDSLIAGLELRGQHGVIHNSLQHDLTRIAKALENDDAR